MSKCRIVVAQKFKDTCTVSYNYGTPNLKHTRCARVFLCEMNHLLPGHLPIHAQAKAKGGGVMPGSRCGMQLRVHEAMVECEWVPDLG